MIAYLLGTADIGLTYDGALPVALHGFIKTQNLIDHFLNLLSFYW